MKPQAKGAGQFADEGFEIIPDVVEAAECDALALELSALFDSRQNLAESRIGGVRNLLGTSARVAGLASSPAVTGLLAKILGGPVFPVRAICFDKTGDSNWFAPWHQDLTIAVVRRIATPGFGAWSTKDGVAHVQPPQAMLEGMVTVRLHLDDCTADNGALRIIPRSHLHGRLAAAEIAAWTQKRAVVCEVPKGGALLMRPLLLHSSLPAKTLWHRRVLHIEYAATELPNGLEWFERK